MVCIAILNWNGFEDTIECIKSLKEITYDDYFIVIGDNGSTNNSIERIKCACDELSITNFLVEYEKEIDILLNKGNIVLYDLKENQGFARGNNLIIKYAKRYTPDYFLLLNNDTVVEKNFLNQLIDFAQKNPEHQILTPQINYFYDKNLVWNCGGRLCWGFRKYYYAGTNERYIKEKNTIDISFITGCALFVNSNLIQDYGLFSERYFHGEEDFDFSIRMKKERRKMTCVLSSKIYHKVNASTMKYKKSKGKMYLYYLQRHMDMHSHLSTISYCVWENINYFNIFLLAIRKGYTLSEIYTILNKVRVESKRVEKISRDYFFYYLSGNL